MKKVLKTLGLQHRRDNLSVEIEVVCQGHPFGTVLQSYSHVVVQSGAFGVLPKAYLRENTEYLSPKTSDCKTAELHDCRTSQIS